MTGRKAGGPHSGTALSNLLGWAVKWNCSLPIHVHFYIFAFFFFFLILFSLSRSLCFVLRDLSGCFQAAVRLRPFTLGLPVISPTDHCVSRPPVPLVTHASSLIPKHFTSFKMKCVQEQLGGVRWYIFFVFLVCYNESCLLLAGGESPCLPDSLHISAAVEEDMAVVILLSGRWEGPDTHTHIEAHTHTNTHTYSFGDNN